MANSALYRTNTAPSASGYKYTFSAWVKRSKITDRQQFWRVLNPSATTYYSYLEFQADDKLHFNDYSSNGTLDVATNRLFRDTNAWYHIMAVVDTTQGTASDRIKLYINGAQETSLVGTTYSLGQNQATTGTESGKNNYVGGDLANNTRFFNGYMSHVSFVDGQALAPTVFGQTDSTSGIWKFKSPTGVTWGNNGYHLKFENSGNLGLDSSGEGHNLTVSGNGRQAVDTPSNVHATFNPLWGTAGKTWTNGNTSYAYGNNYQRSSLFTLYSQYKFYLEWKTSSSTAVFHFNLTNEQLANDGRFGLDTSNNASYRINDSSNALTFVHAGNTDGVVNINGSAVSATDLIRISTSDVAMMAFDPATGKLWLGKNGTWDKSGDPANGNNPIYTWSSGNYTVGDPIYGGFGTEGGNRVDANFGNGFFGTTAISSAGSNGNGSLFEYDVPSGFYALNTKNTNTYG